MPRIIKPAKGTFTAANITVDSSGRVVTAASGAAAANMILTGIHTAPQSGAQSNHVTSANTNKMHVYLRGGGGGGGGGQQGGRGGCGGFGACSVPVSSAPATVPFSIGAGSGQLPDPNSPGATGGTTTFDSNHNALGGNGGGRGPSPGNPGTMGNVGPNAVANYGSPSSPMTEAQFVYTAFGGGVGTQDVGGGNDTTDYSFPGVGGKRAGSGRQGMALVYEDIG